MEQQYGDYTLADFIAALMWDGSTFTVEEIVAALHTRFSDGSGGLSPQRLEAEVAARFETL